MSKSTEKNENANGTDTGAVAAVKVRVKLQALAYGTQAAGRSDSERAKERRKCKGDDIRSTILHWKLTVVMHPNHQDLLVQVSKTTRRDVFHV